MKPFLALLAILAASPALAAEPEPAPAASPAVEAVPTPEAFKPSSKISGFMFGDFFYLARQSNNAQEGKHGTWFRRIYFTYDAEIDPLSSVRLRLEALQGDTSAAPAAMTPFLKDAYLKRKLFGSHAALIGLIDSPSWGVTEEYWGYRSMEKTPLDLQGWAAPRDLGLAFKGELLDGKVLTYHLMAGNGSSINSESDAAKKYYLAFQFRPFKGALAELYGDYASLKGNDPEDYTYTLQLLLGYGGGWGRLGLQFDRQDRVPSLGAAEIRQEQASGFAVVNLAESLSLVLRMDHLLWGTVNRAGTAYLGGAAQRSTLGLAGLDWRLSPQVKIQPNVTLVYYQNDSGGPVPEEEVVPKLTFYYGF